MSKKILITGSSTGIGYHCAKRLIADGYNVVASCRTQQDVTRLQNEGVHSVLLDLSDEKKIQ